MVVDSGQVKEHAAMKTLIDNGWIDGSVEGMGLRLRLGEKAKKVPGGASGSLSVPRGSRLRHRGRVICPKCGITREVGTRQPGGIGAAHASGTCKPRQRAVRGDTQPRGR